MPDDVATLRDTVVTEDSVAPAAESAAPETPAAPRILEAPSPDAAEIGRIILESGFTKDQLNDLLQAPRALDSLRNLLQNNPQEFLNTIERTDPRTHETLLDAASDKFVQRYGSKEPRGNSKEDSTNDLMREVEALREKTNRLESEQSRRDQAAALAATRQRYQARVDDLLSLKEVKELGLTKSEAKAFRARLDSELGADPTVVQRVSNGNFVDVPKAFQGILDEWVSDKKAASEAEKTQRERASKSGFPEFLSGPNLLNVDIPTGTFDSWDNTEEGFAKALERAR